MNQWTVSLPSPPRITPSGTHARTAPALRGEHIRVMPRSSHIPASSFLGLGRGGPGEPLPRGLTFSLSVLGACLALVFVLCLKIESSLVSLLKSLQQRPLPLGEGRPPSRLGGPLSCPPCLPQPPLLGGLFSSGWTSVGACSLLTCCHAARSGLSSVGHMAVSNN